MTLSPTAKRCLLAAVLAAIALTAALGIAAILVSDFGEFPTKLLATSAALTGAGVFVLALLPALERRRLGPVPALGVAASLLGFGLVIAGAWGEWDNEVFWKVTGTILWAAGWAVWSSLLSLGRLAPRYRWTFWAASLSSLALTVLFVVAIWGEFSSSGFWKAFAVVAVLAAALTITVPVLHRASRQDILPTEGADRVRYCPRCSRGVVGAAGEELSCPGCGACFVVRLIGAGPDPTG